jgi:hypothetical protein
VNEEFSFTVAQVRPAVKGNLERVGSALEARREDSPPDGFASKVDFGGNEFRV